MFAHASVLILGLLVTQPGGASQPQQSVAVLAQAQDRCMATYAVRLTRTEAADEEIFSAASEGCEQLSDQLNAAIAREYPADQARELLTVIEANSRPNFIQMLQRIRTDRQNRAQGRVQ